MKAKLVSGDEMDIFSKRYRQRMHWFPGYIRKVKRLFWHRERSRNKKDLSRVMTEIECNGQITYVGNLEWTKGGCYD